MANFGKKQLVLFGLGLSVFMGASGYMVGESLAPRPDKGPALEVAAAQAAQIAHLTQAARQPQAASYENPVGHDAVGGDGVAEPAWRYEQPMAHIRIAYLESANVVDLPGGVSAHAQIVVDHNKADPFAPQVKIRVDRSVLGCSPYMKMHCSIQVMFDGTTHNFFVKRTAKRTFQLMAPELFMKRLLAASHVVVFTNMQDQPRAEFGFVPDGYTKF